MLAVERRVVKRQVRVCTFVSMNAGRWGCFRACTYDTLFIVLIGPIAVEGQDLWSCRLVVNTIPRQFLASRSS